ncbi:hypothetical protein J6590_083082 [Homalodisca vitripennis]|nr:hypothetical protein J6590_083082 [Homalodisca vitripennis]
MNENNNYIARNIILGGSKLLAVQSSCINYSISRAYDRVRQIVDTFPKNFEVWGGGGCATWIGVETAMITSIVLVVAECLVASSGSKTVDSHVAVALCSTKSASTNEINYVFGNTPLSQIVKDSLSPEIKTTGDVPWGSLVERGRRGPRPGQRGVQDHQKSCVGLVDGERWTTRGMIHSERENKQRVSSTPPAERINEPRLLILKGLERGLRVGDVISGQ